MLLFYDTETTGLPLWDKPSGLPEQPHLVQVAAALVDDDYKTCGLIDLIVRPDGWVSGAKALATHNITHDHAMAVGLPEETVLGVFIDLWRKSTLRVAHNEPFDARLMRIAIKRYLHEDFAGYWKSGAKFCTQGASTKIVNAPPTDAMMAAGRKHAKTASLAEAYQHFTGKEIVGAHNALADLKACMAVYQGLMKLKGEDQ